MRQNLLELEFHKWSTCGNLTLIFPALIGSDSCQNNSQKELRQKIASLSLAPEYLGAEQAGFLDQENLILNMAGGEFCVNATLATAAHLALALNQNELETQCQVSGYEQAIEIWAKKLKTKWQAGLTLVLDQCKIVSAYALEAKQISDNIADNIKNALKSASIKVVFLPGICHILIPEKEVPFPEDWQNFGANLRKIYGLEDAKACGLIFWQEHEKYFSIKPAIYVKEINSNIIEKACGSGSLALALALYNDASEKREFVIKQQSLGNLEIELTKVEQGFRAKIVSEVELIAKGSVFFSFNR